MGNSVNWTKPVIQHIITTLMTPQSGLANTACVPLGKLLPRMILVPRATSPSILRSTCYGGQAAISPNFVGGEGESSSVLQKTDAHLKK
jgi:hypothetical protein